MPMITSIPTCTTRVQAAVDLITAGSAAMNAALDDMTSNDKMTNDQLGKMNDALNVMREGSLNFKDAIIELKAAVLIELDDRNDPR